MKILIDINHPAHVHYFRYFIEKMTVKGHEIVITARDKEITFELLDTYGIEYYSRGKGCKTLLGKLLNIPIADYKIFVAARKFNPDIFISFASTYAAHVSKILRKPHIAFDDTEHAIWEFLMYSPFSDVLLTPKYFTKELGNKQIRFDSLMELLYLHHRYFLPNINVFKDLGLKENEEYAILRFVSWEASHDIGQHGLSVENKIQIVNRLIEHNVKVFISSESELPVELEKYHFNIPSNKFHNALYYAMIYIGEGGTTASEAAILGTPVIYVNTLEMGYIEAEKKAGLILQTCDISKIDSKIKKICLNKETRRVFLDKRNNFLEDKIDLTAFLVWFIENFPQSYKIMKENPEYQYKFK